MGPLLLSSTQQREFFMPHFLNLSLSSLKTMLERGETTSVQLVEQALEGFDQLNPLINAVVTTHPELSIRYAEKADTLRAKGEIVGPLHGIPMTIKDSLDTFDMNTTWGTVGRRAHRPGHDAISVARLRAAGAILVGKTNTPELTLSYQTDNSIFGRTSNPHDIDRTSGGSSGGAAALIAAGGTPIDLGTDTGGSIRLPAHFCGVYGLKPTTGRVPTTGNALPSTGLLAPLSQIGPLSRSLEDLTLIYKIIQGPHHTDPYTLDAPDRAATEEVAQLRVGFFADHGLGTPSGAIKESLSSLINTLADKGCDVREIRPEGIEMTSMLYGQLFNADGHEMIADQLHASGTETPSLSLQRILSQPKSQLSASELSHLISLWDGYRSSMRSVFESVDVILCPVNGRTALLHDEEENPYDYLYTQAFNLTGWPGLSMPSATDEKGLPVGIQIVAPPLMEERCLSVARFLEANLEPLSKPKVYLES